MKCADLSVSNNSSGTVIFRLSVNFYTIVTRVRELSRIQWTLLGEGGVRVCGIAVLGYFWCGVAVSFISKYGIAVFRVQAVCGEFEFYVAVVGEKIVVSR